MHDFSHKIYFYCWKKLKNMFYTLEKISEKPYEVVASIPPPPPATPFPSPVRPRVKMFQKSLDYKASLL